MPVSKKNFLDRFSERFDDLDANSRQAYILRIVRERGFFETVFNTVDEGILVVDRKLRIRYFNRTAKEMLALPDDLSQVRISQLLHDIDWRRMLREDEEEWTRLARQELEILYPQRRFIQFYLVPLPEDAGLAAVILRDVTESRTRTRSEMEQQTSQAVSMLAAGVAHEIGNPLNSISLNLQILRQTLEDGDFDRTEAKEMLRICESEVERLDSIIHSFLSAIRPGKPQFSLVGLREIIVAVLNFMRPEIEARKVAVKCSFSGELPPVNGDANLLKQAFYNVIRNAVQAMSNGGELTIFGYSEPEFLVLEFADTGCGISADHLSNMFQAFHTTKAGGNGIGTMIVERICREHGADFGLVTSPGKGTVFQIRFPQGKRRIRMLTDTPPEPGAGSRV